MVKVLDFDAPYCPTLARRRDCGRDCGRSGPGEGARLQSCDVFIDFDISGVPSYQGMAAINVMPCKNDQDWKHYLPRIGRLRSEGLKLVHQLCRFMEEAGTELRSGCFKRLRPHARCLLARSQNEASTG